jgi:RNA polymerase sigma-70 factor (ECF subfamily)
MTLARSRALDRLRFRRRRAAVWIELGAPEGADEQVADRGLTPFEHATASRERLALEQALGELPPSHRRAVELNFFEGLSHTEIAARLGDPLGTVKTRIRQGLLAMRKTLRSFADGGSSS